MCIARIEQCRVDNEDRERQEEKRHDQRGHDQHLAVLRVQPCHGVLLRYGSISACACQVTSTLRPSTCEMLGNAARFTYPRAVTVRVDPPWNEPVSMATWRFSICDPPTPPAPPPFPSPRTPLPP